MQIYLCNFLMIVYANILQKLAQLDAGLCKALNTRGNQSASPRYQRPKITDSGLSKIR